MREACERGHVSLLPHFNSVLNVLDNPATTPILTDLITRSSLPLRAVESQFAVNSSGFSTSRFTRWYDEKYGYNRQQADWVKAHLCVGTKTQVVTACVIGEEDSADCPQLAGPVNATAQNFAVKELSADKAYLSHDNLALVDGMGASRSFRSRATARAAGRRSGGGCTSTSGSTATTT